MHVLHCLALQNCCNVHHTQRWFILCLRHQQNEFGLTPMPRLIRCVITGISGTNITVEPICWKSLIARNGGKLVSITHSTGPSSFLTKGFVPVPVPVNDCCCCVFTGCFCLATNMFVMSKLDLSYCSPLHRLLLTISWVLQTSLGQVVTSNTNTTHKHSTHAHKAQGTWSKTQDTRHNPITTYISPPLLSLCVCMCRLSLSLSLSFATSLYLSNLSISISISI